MGLVRAIRRRSPAELWTRLQQRALAVGERVGVARVASDAPALTTGWPSDPDAIWSRSRERLPFPAGAEFADATAAVLRKRGPDELSAALDAASRIRGGAYPLMGFGWVSVGVPPDWHREPISGQRAPTQHWSQIAYLDPAVVGDHKALWEFNRHQHLVTLAQAALLTGDEEWAMLAREQMDSWMLSNPPHRGVHWASSLEVAYRAISWCWTVRMLRGSRVFDGPFLSRVRIAMHAHGVHVARYLSTYFSPNTHLTGEALGLVYIGSAFPELARSASWYARGRDILLEQLQVQVHADGVYFEQATQYHRYTLELYVHLLLLLEARADHRAAALRAPTSRIFDVLWALERADGTMALLGDDDGGRLMQFDAERPHRIDGILLAAACVLDRPEAYNPRWSRAYAAWMLGAARVDAWCAAADSSRSSRPAGTRPAAFSQGGLYVMRDFANSTDHVTLDAAPHGALSHGHSHADALAIEYFASGGPLVVDRGTYTYVGADRDWFRGATAHNVALSDAAALNRTSTPFRWHSWTDGRCDGWSRADDVAWFRGAETSAERVVHRRDVWRPAPGVLVVEDDRADRAGGLTIYWHLAPSFRARIRSAVDSVVIVDLDVDGRVTASVVMEAASAAVRIESEWHSPQFGHRERAEGLVAETTVTAARPARTVFVDWMQRGGAPVVLETCEGPITLRADANSAPVAGPWSRLHLAAATHSTGDDVRVTSRLAWVDGGESDVIHRLVAVDVVPEHVELAGGDAVRTGQWLVWQQGQSMVSGSLSSGV